MMHKLWSWFQSHILLIVVFGAGLATGIVTLLVGISFFSFPGTGGAAAASVTSPFTYHYSVDGILHEAGSMSRTTSPYWWVNSGGGLVLKDGVGQTMHGDAPASNYWGTLYAITNSVDTDRGLHPQNIFRLVSRSEWRNIRVESDFYITRDNLSSSPNRNASNGLLLMSRYQSGDTLYYAGIRVDGNAVIKKKYRGTYYTMAQKKVFPGTYGADNENLLPHNEWIRMRSDTVTNEGGTVTVTLSIKRAGGSWEQLLKVTDTGKNFDGTSPISWEGYTGIRTDFMDVKFENYRIESL